MKGVMGYRFGRVLPVITAVVMLYMILPGSVDAANPDLKFMSVDEVKPGMEGIGKTVFSGNKIGEFGVEIIGVLKGVYPKGDLILARLEGGGLEETGLISGMSGSPVYIDGKLIGAVSYGWGYVDEPVAGITPIMEMLPLLEETRTSGETVCDTGMDFKHSLSIGRRNIKEIVVSPNADEGGNHSTMVLTPLGTPVMAGGFARGVMKTAAGFFEGCGLTLLMGAGGAGGNCGDVMPGSVVGVQLLRGDSNLTALGTLTYRKGGKILAFGHPFLGIGQVSLPMTGGYIHTIVSSRLVSFKIGSPSEPIGRIDRDARTAIGGELDRQAEMVPLLVKVEGAFTPEIFKYEMAKQETWTPELLKLCMLNSVSSLGLAVEEGVEVVLHIKLKNRNNPIVVKQMFRTSGSKRQWVEAVAGVLDAIMNNRFKEVEVEDVKVDVRLIDKPVFASIEGVRVNKTEVKPGETVEMVVVLKIFPQERKLIRTEINLPEDLPDGELAFLVSDAAGSRKLTQSINPERLCPHSFEQMVELICGSEKNNEVIVRVMTPFEGVVVRGEELPLLPPSLISIMSSAKATGVKRFSDEIIRKIPTDWFISGETKLKINVEGG